MQFDTNQSFKKSNLTDFQLTAYCRESAQKATDRGFFFDHQGPQDFEELAVYAVDSTLKIDAEMLAPPHLALLAAGSHQSTAADQTSAVFIGLNRWASATCGGTLPLREIKVFKRQWMTGSSAALAPYSKITEYLFPFPNPVRNP